MTRRLILLRHGQTEYNATQRMQGQLDTDLSDVGREGARTVAAALEGAGIDRIISSDLQRAMDTADAVGQRLSIPVTHDERLRETHLGKWQGLSHAEVDEQFPGDREQWRSDANWAPPGGESRIEVARRAQPVIDELGEWENTLLVVAHGGTISALTGALVDFTDEMYPALGTLGNTRFGVLIYRGGRWLIQAWNVAEVPW